MLLFNFLRLHKFDLDLSVSASIPWSAPRYITQSTAVAALMVLAFISAVRIPLLLHETPHSFSNSSFIIMISFLVTHTFPVYQDQAAALLGVSLMLQQ